MKIGRVSPTSVWLKRSLVKALRCTKATSKVQNLDEGAEELIAATIVAVQLWKGTAGTHVALVQLPVADANKSDKLGILKCWFVCPVGIHESLEASEVFRTGAHRNTGTVKIPTEASFVDDVEIKVIRPHEPEVFDFGKSANSKYPMEGPR